MHNISNLFYFGTALYMFWAVFPSIIRSLGLYAQCQAYVIQELRSISLPLAGSWLNLYDIYLMLYVQSQTPDDGRKDRSKHVEC
jgi:hypothetical protein